MSNNLIIYDRVLDTYFHPERQVDSSRHIEEIGLINLDYPKDYIGQLAARFKPGLDQES